MDVAITGGRGQTGRWVVDHLAEDHTVTCLDQDHPGDDGHPDVAYRALDLTDQGSVFDTLTRLEPDAVVHWAAIPAAGIRPGVDTYRNNTLAAHSVLTAAGRIGARVVQASSDGAYGFFFADETPVPDELPISEAHARRPEDDYGLSKVVAEEIGKTIARRDDVPVMSLRPSWIQVPGEYPCRDEEYTSNLEAGAGNFWSYVDVRDVADMVEAALTADVSGHETFNCVATDNALGRPLRELMTDYYGTVPATCSVEGDASAYDITKANNLLDWEPTRSWRDAATETIPTPRV
ncbi:NAD-dependent epimerase/dehydratase family protein [Haloferax sp. MBLA0076]|uniref:NAD-dependent epimerase/dehydratase family protein n=1 Tax=Haloferax litoreum TaxID=2666140 RepID=A0A6A8GK66_9EURY|nr:MULTISPECIES: NAD(P)-dependent oxidoreductase [Haloferax]KAB1190515.1 NAD(P)-dependent oxidoreductase [Haloferax sp. CBA1148]MRX23495.1 NAD-dependent epimerase/dehydratase family protein [Haloferax litoreum]